jgi:glutathione synthase/RimK-type ligase-like ATP-grasp enzyme
MNPILVVDHPQRWPLSIEGVEVVSARSYLTDPAFAERRGIKVFNLCRSYRYQQSGYYVSLLAEARGHRPVPRLSAVQDMKASEIVRIRSEDLHRLIQRSLAPIRSDRFVLSVYFGRSIAKRHNSLGAQLGALFEAPLLRATFSRSNGAEWELNGARTIAAEDIPPEHHDFVLQAASDYFARRRYRTRNKKHARYDIAILVDPEEQEPPSDERALTRFTKAARSAGMTPWVVDRSEYPRIADYDALFLRATTNVNHFTFRFARRAAAEDMVVIDDPESILRCTNKVYLAEILARHGLPAPATMVVHRGNLDEVPQRLGFPCVLKSPDGCFSQGVKKVDNERELHDVAEGILASSELLVAQAFLPTSFDWRVGLFDGQPLWVCKYHMAPSHWQIAKEQKGRRRYGQVEPVPIAAAPSAVVRMALKAAALVGNGLYGVDLKEDRGRVRVIEINDNPTIEAGSEDAVLGDELYRRIMDGFHRRLDGIRGAGETT